MRPIDRLSPEVRKLLVKSRNRIAGLILRQPPPSPTEVAPQIDIAEPISIASGQQKNVPFAYRAGVPTATHFDLEWFRTEADANLQRHPLTDNIPTVSIRPEVPAADIGEDSFGIVTIIAPEVSTDTILYGVISITQE